MKLTEKEKEICKEYSINPDTGLSNCYSCPLAICHSLCECYATIDGRTREAKQLKRYKAEGKDNG